MVNSLSSRDYFVLADESMVSKFSEIVEHFQNNVHISGMANVPYSKIKIFNVAKQRKNSTIPLQFSENTQCTFTV